MAAPEYGSEPSPAHCTVFLHPGYGARGSEDQILGPVACWIADIGLKWVPYRPSTISSTPMTLIAMPTTSRIDGRSPSRATAIDAEKIGDTDESADVRAAPTRETSWLTRS